ncbi:hypothetical protein J8F10_25930 [Gemmata sp. G18]|uniref:VWFA domain-containing protein n=1 Tax=Gemmata palustris TaxID=2822762 RepID=A0ABS5BZN7_9BACT|nr:SAV_2336 N-terminal domain-related protein [Gemmata palustris]MBP3958700.1 hypothetical protein [Gemmata palustris]
MSKPATSNTLNGVVEQCKLLDGMNVEYTAEDVADAVWLAARMCEVRVPEEQEIRAPSAAEQADSPPRPDDSVAPVRTSVGESAVPMEERAPVYLPRSESKIGGTSLRIPLPTPAPDIPKLAHALRALMARQPSRARNILNIDATARRFSEEQFLDPVYTPDSVRGVDLSVVLDIGPSMAVWAHTQAELLQELERLRGFRQVRVGTLESGGAAPVVRFTSSVSNSQKGNPGSNEGLGLIRSSYRNVVLVVTDAVSAAWHSAGIGKMLAEWSRRGRVAIVQVLPPRLWSRTALGPLPEVVLRSLGDIHELMRDIHCQGEQNRRDEPLIPVVPLSQEGLRNLSLLIVGRRKVSVAGRVFVNSTSGRGQLNSGIADRDVLSHFRRAASPQARRLAALLTSTNRVNLQVLRLLAAVGDEAGNRLSMEHVAEVWLGNLLTPLSPDVYTFRAGVRDGLGNELSSTEGRELVKRTADTIKANLHRHSRLSGVVRGNDSVGRWSESLTQLSGDILRELCEEWARQLPFEAGDSLREPSSRCDSLTAGEESHFEEQMLLGMESGPLDPRALPKVVTGILDLHQTVREWVEKSAKVQEHEHIKQNLAYVDLLFSFALGKLGESTQAKKLLEDVWMSLDTPVSMINESAIIKTEVRKILFMAFKYRIEQAIIGGTHAGPMSPEVTKAREIIAVKSRNEGINNPYKTIVYAIDRMFEVSMVLEPHERIDSSQEYYNRAIKLREVFRELSAMHDAQTLADRIRRLYREGASGEKSTKDEQSWILRHTIPLTLRVSADFAAEMLEYVVEGRPFDWSAEYREWKVSPWRAEGQLLTRSLFVAAHFGYDKIAKKLVTHFADLVHSSKAESRFKLICEGAGQLFRSLQRLGLMDEAKQFLTQLQVKVLEGAKLEKLRKKYAHEPRSWNRVLQTLLSLAAGWMRFGMKDQALPILNEARNNLLNQNGSDLQSLDYTNLATMYVGALAQAPLEVAQAQITELFEAMDPRRISNTFTTAPYYSRLHFVLVEATILSLCRMAYRVDL